MLRLLLLHFRERRLQQAEEPLSHPGRKSAGSQTNMAYRHIEQHLSHDDQEATLWPAGRRRSEASALICPPPPLFFYIFFF